MSVVDELVLAARALRRAPIFAVVSIASLAVGIGANVAVFSLANTLLLRPLPVPDAERLVRVGRRTQEMGFGAVSFAEYRDIAAAIARSADLVGHYPSTAIVTAPDGPKQEWLELVSANYFGALRVRPALGRGFSGDDDRVAAANPVIVISNRLWRDRFGGDTGVIGRSMRLNGRSFTIVGVAPSNFRGTFTGFAIDGWVPVTMQAVVSPGAGTLDERESRFLMLIAALRTGADEPGLHAMLSVAASRLQSAQQDARRPVRLELASAGGVHPFVARLVRAFVGMLQSIVLLVLLIACVNLANVLLVRASARQRELSVRAALGATRWRLARVALMEAVLIAITGGLVGTVLAALAGRALSRLDLPVGIPLGLTIGVDGAVLAAALAITTVTVVAFGAGPALAASRASALANLRVGGGTTDRRRARVRATLVCAQVAIATVLLVGSGLAIRSLRESALLNPGFSQSRVHVLSASPDLLGYDESRGRALWEEIVSSTNRVPGVERASLALFVPLGSRGDQLIIGPDGRQASERPFPYNYVRPGYFGTLGIRLIAGRDLSPNDDTRSPDVVVVSQAMARRFFGDSNAIGQTIRVEDRGRRVRRATIVGVVADIKLRSMGEGPAPIAYLPFGQWYRPDMVMHVRVSENADRVLPRIMEQVRAAEPDLAMDVQPMSRATEFAMIPLRVAGAVLGFCGVVGVLLAAFGVFGLVAYTVSLRTREIGIRVALGAGRGALTRLVAMQALRPVGVGLVLGLALSAGAAGAIRGLLVGIQPIDPVSLAAASVLLLAAGAAALVTPIRRAMRIEPATVLRSE
jgi:predicted permease